MQAVDIQDTGNGVIATCRFLLGSPAQGCQVEFNCTRTGLARSVKILKRATAMTATFILTNLEECLYNVLVSDVEQDGSVNPIPAVIVSAWLSTSMNSYITTRDISATESKLTTTTI